MKFQFQRFYPLYNHMKQTKKLQEKFSFEINRVCFQVIFLIDRTPFQLLIGIADYSLAFVLEVQRGFKTELPDIIYYQICKILNLKYSEDHFSSAKFLRELDSQVPDHCTPYHVEPHEIAPYYKRDIPDSEKIYFLGWNNHLADGKKARNIEKTRLLLGDTVADFCEKNNISSLWTDIPRETKKYFNPPGFSK